MSVATAMTDKKETRHGQTKRMTRGKKGVFRPRDVWLLLSLIDDKTQSAQPWSVRFTQNIDTTYENIILLVIA